MITPSGRDLSLRQPRRHHHQLVVPRPRHPRPRMLLGRSPLPPRRRHEHSRQPRRRPQPVVPRLLQQRHRTLRSSRRLVPRPRRELRPRRPQVRPHREPHRARPQRFVRGAGQGSACIGVVDLDGEHAAGPGDQHVLRRRPAAGYGRLSLPGQAEAEQCLGLHPRGIVRPGQLHRPPRPLHHLAGPQPSHRVQRQPLRRQGGHLGTGGVTIGPRAVQQAVRLGSSALQDRDVARGDVLQRTARRRSPIVARACRRRPRRRRAGRPPAVHVDRAAPGER